MKIRTWMIEQAVLVVLVSIGTATQLRGLHDTHQLGGVATLPIVLAAITTIVAQMVRSIADRQREADTAAGVTPAAIECAQAQARWGAVLQAIGVLTGVVLAPTGWHVGIMLYAALYSMAWRPAYRRWIRPLPVRSTRNENAGTS